MIYATQRTQRHRYNSSSVMIILVRLMPLITWIVYMSSMISSVSAAPFTTQYEYAKQRRQLIDDTSKIHFASDISLNEDEVIVDHYLDYILREEQKRVRSLGVFPPATYFTKVRPLIAASPLYSSFLRRMPKGGNLHLHAGAAVDRYWLLQQFYHHSDFYVYNDTDSSDARTLRGSLGFWRHPPAGWVSALTWTLDDLYVGITLRDWTGGMDTDTWTQFSATGTRISALLAFDQAFHVWWKKFLEEAVDDNVQYVEARISTGFRYKLTDSLVDGGRVIIDPTLGNDDTDAMISYTREVMREQGEAFFDVAAIWQASRSQSQQLNFEAMLRFQKLRQRNPEWWIGFDFVGQEDKGHSLLYLIEPLRLALMGRNTTDDPLLQYHSTHQMLPSHRTNEQFATNAASAPSVASVNDDSLLSSFRVGEGWSTSSPLPLYLHSGESDWPSGSTYANDIQAPVDNLYDAILLGSRRIGHGISLFKRPGLLELAKKHDVALEICPISHQLLGYVSDLRNHPAIGYMAAGVQIVIASDDHGAFGYGGLTYDFYIATLGWNLNLASLKKIAVNSLTYSGMSASRLAEALESWNERWRLWIEGQRMEACRLLSDQINDRNASQPQFSFVFPNMGPAHLSNRIIVYGTSFQSAICRDIFCRFGPYNTTTQATYVNANQIECVTPIVTHLTHTFSVDRQWIEVTLDGGRHWWNTSQRYSFVVEPVGEDSSHEYTWLHYLGILLGSLFVVFIGVWCYFRRRRAAMDSEAYNNIINQLDPALAAGGRVIQHT